MVGINPEDKATAAVDRFGVILSGLCLVHCLAGPFLLSLFPLLETLPHESLVHSFLGVGLLGTAGYAFWRGYVHHQEIRILILGSVGLVLLCIGLFSPHLVLWSLFSAQALVTSLGGISLIAAHLWNLRLCHHAGAHRD